MTDQISLRPPSTANLPPKDVPLPSIDYYPGTWYITHSTLPLWKTKRNSFLTYKRLEPSKGWHQEVFPRLDDTSTYQHLDSDKIRTIHGIDTASGEAPGIWNWRGTGWLKLVTSRWEVLGFGEDAGVRWMLIFFTATFATPIGIDILSSEKKGVSEELVTAIQSALREIDDPVVQKLAEDLFRVKQELP